VAGNFVKTGRKCVVDRRAAFTAKALIDPARLSRRQMVVFDFLKPRLYGVADPNRRPAPRATVAVLPAGARNRLWSADGTKSCTAKGRNEMCIGWKSGFMDLFPDGSFLKNAWKGAERACNPFGWGR